jgi:tRNA (mo5U34)-methyltransferase
MEGEVATEQRGERERRLEAARRALRENPELWYHTIELAPGIVTPGYIDLRRAAPKVLPADLGGRRALDIGTFDGFWAFELERRGASVVTIDLERIDDAEFPPLSRPMLERRAWEQGVELGHGFRLAAKALGSGVERRVCNVYDLTSDAIGGPVDVAFNGTTMTHLRDPVGALERIREALVPGGEVYCFEPISLWLSLRAPRRPAAAFGAHNTDYTWWEPNLAAIGAWLAAAGFSEVRRIGVVRPPSSERRPAFHAAFSARRPA